MFLNSHHTSRTVVSTLWVYYSSSMVAPARTLFYSVETTITTTKVQKGRWSIHTGVRTRIWNSLWTLTFSWVLVSSDAPVVLTFANSANLHCSNFFLPRTFTCLHAGVCLWQQRTEELPDLLQLELKTVVSHRVGFRDRTPVLCKSDQST